MTQTTTISNEAISDALLGERTFGWGTLAQRPTSNFHANGWFFVTDTSKMYQNTGTEATPVWTLRWETVDAGLVLALG